MEDYPMRLENEEDYDETEKAWLKAIFNQMSNHELLDLWSEEEAIAFIRDVRNPNYELTGMELREEVADALIEASYQLAYQQVYVLNNPTEQESDEFQQQIADEKKDAIDRMIREKMTDEQVIALTHDMYPEDYRNPSVTNFGYLP